MLSPILLGGGLRICILKQHSRYSHLPSRFQKQWFYGKPQSHTFQQKYCSTCPEISWEAQTILWSLKSPYIIRWYISLLIINDWH